MLFLKTSKCSKEIMRRLLNETSGIKKKKERQKQK
jgi:hypothetical protein